MCFPSGICKDGLKASRQGCPHVAGGEANVEEMPSRSGICSDEQRHPSRDAEKLAGGQAHAEGVAATTGRHVEK
jgi:hypothetical protein